MRVLFLMGRYITRSWQSAYRRILCSQGTTICTNCVIATDLTVRHVETVYSTASFEVLRFEMRSRNGVYDAIDRSESTVP